MKPLWTPKREPVAAARITGFEERARREGVAVRDWDDLWRWSVTDREAFWSLAFDFLGIRGEKGERVVVDPDLMPGARWFPDARLSFAENLLAGPAEETAILAFAEDRPRREVSRGELRRLAAGIAAGLEAAGVGPGDAVAGFLPNVPEAVAAAAAANSLGAVWSSTSPDFGTAGALDRLGQIAPKVLFTADGYRFGGKAFDSLGKAGAIAAALPAGTRVVVVPRLAERPDLSRVPGAESLADFAAGGGDEPEYRRLPFDHPLYVLFSSGTTGAPKGIVHGQGGTLLNHAKEHVLHTDVRPGTRILYYTTTGWMMWNWLVSALASGATIVLVDGSPFHPGPEALWRLVDEERIEVFGTSAKYLAAVEKAGFVPREHYRLDALRTLLSTGSPLSAGSFRWVYGNVKQDLLLSSISGGTDIVGCFALGNPTLPVWPGELQCRGLGMDVQAFDPRGRTVVGEKGELVCRRSFPNMPVAFVGDPDGARYRAAYFERFPGAWHHGDYVTLTERGGLVIHGRSDATLNPGGVRIGTAEIDRRVTAFPEVADALVVGQRRGDDERIVLFVRLAAGAALDDDLRERIRRAIREGASPRHVPAKIVAVADIPYTRSGKKVEIAVRRVIHGEPVENREALANPEALDLYRDLPELAD